MFQGAVALPLAFFLERRMGSKRMEPGNPLRPLSGQMAVSQGLALPALIAIYSLDPALSPLGLASVGGVHFLPYAWLHRTRIYIYLAATLSVGALLLQLFLTGAEFTVILFFIAITYWATVLPTFRHAARLVAKMGIQGGAQ
jgi:hypothetical protein